jgi:endonuclease YncB( thermonuclease family)
MELRPDIAAAAERMVARDRVVEELRQLAACLHKREVVARLSSGRSAAGYSLLAITNRRVILLREGYAGQVSRSFRLKELTTAQWSPSLLAGTITFADPVSCAQLGQVELAEGEEISRLIQERIGARKRAWPFHRKAVGANATLQAQPDDELDTEILMRIDGWRADQFAHTGRRPASHRAVQQGRSSGWLAAAVGGLIGLAGAGSYLLLTEQSSTPYALDTSELAAMNVAPAPAAQQPPAATRPTNAVVGVVRVIDADSFEAAGGVTGPVEVLGIQAPADGQCGAAQSVSFAMSKLNGTAVTLVTDPASPGIDGAGRLLAHVVLPNGADYAVVAARAGMVKYHAPGTPDPRADQIKIAQAEAQRAGAGLWGACGGSGA